MKNYITYLLLNLHTLPLKNIKEEVTKVKIIYPMLQLSGFNIMDLLNVEEEFDTLTGDSSHPIEMDICLKNNGVPIAFLQCKQTGLKSRLRNDHLKTFKAASLNQIPYVIFTDGEYWEFYKYDGLKYSSTRQLNLRFDQTKYKEVVDILGYIRKEKYE